VGSRSKASVGGLEGLVGSPAEAVLEIFLVKWQKILSSKTNFR